MIELLGEAEIQSPLSEVPSAKSLEDLELASRVVISDDFEQRPYSGKCPAVSVSNGDGPNTALECVSGSPFMFLPVEPGRYYQLRISARADDSRCRPLMISEKPYGNAYRLTYRADKRWHDLSQSFFTGRQTTSMLVHLQKSDCTVWLDNLKLEELHVSPEQELSLLKGQSPAEFARVDLGMAKHGRFLAPSAAPLEIGLDENYSVRDAILAPPPTTIEYAVDIPQRAKLNFSYTLHHFSRPDDCTRFAVKARGADAISTITLHREDLSIDRNQDPMTWQEASLDLSDYADQRIQLLLETTSCGDRPGLALWGYPMITAPRNPDDGPNVLVIAVDTLRADGISAYSGTSAQTPRIDALSKDGVLFRNTITQAPWTLPSFVSMFTGELPSRHRAIFNSRIADDVTTMTEIFRSEGWITKAILAKPALFDSGLEQGFDDYLNDPRSQDYRAENNVVEALQWLDENHDRKFFLFLHFNDPHQPFNLPESFVSEEDLKELESRNLTLPVQVFGKTCKEWDGNVAECRAVFRNLYYDEVEYVDHEIGIVLDRLKEHDIYDQTIIVFVSDHGEALWDHLDFFSHSSRYVFDENIVVPLIIKAQSDADLPRDSVVRDQVRLVDIPPTLIELASLNSEKYDASGRSLVELWQGTARGDRIALTESGGGGAFSVRDGMWKYMYSSWLEQRGSVPERLFDISSDPAEREDLSSKHPEVVRRLRAAGLDSIIANRTGWYAIVVGDGTTTAAEVSLRVGSRDIGMEEFFSSIGPRQRKGRNIDWKGAQKSGRLLLVARVEPHELSEVVLTAEGLSVNGGDRAKLSTQAHAREEKFGEYTSGTLQELLASPDPGVYLFAVESNRGQGRELESIDSRQLEALRALGYIE